MRGMEGMQVLARNFAVRPGRQGPRSELRVAAVRREPRPRRPKMEEA